MQGLAAWIISYGRVSVKCEVEGLTCVQIRGCEEAGGEMRLCEDGILPAEVLRRGLDLREETFLATLQSSLSRVKHLLVNDPEI